MGWRTTWYVPLPARCFLVLATVMGLALAAQPVAAAPVLFKVLQADTSGPPYPSTPPVEMALGVETEFLGLLALDIHSVSAMDSAAMIHATDNGGGGLAGGPGTMAFAPFFYPPSPVHPPNPCTPPGATGGSCTADFRFDTIDGSVSGTSAAFTPSFFDVFADVLFPPGPVRLHIHGATVQPIHFTLVDPADPSFFDVVVTATVDDAIDPVKPLFTMTLTGETLPAPAPAGLMLLSSGLVLLALGSRWR